MAKYFIDHRTGTTAKVVIVENEIGETGIDDRVLENAGFEVKSMFAGCVCCTLSGELVVNYRNIIKEINPDYIIMEATGVAYPVSIKETLVRNLNLDCKICCITDAKRWLRLLKPMGAMIKDQLEDADLILINKTDLVDTDTLAAVDKSLKALNDRATYFQVSAKEAIDDTIWNVLL
jgi:G3E family GTPase